MEIKTSITYATATSISAIIYISSIHESIQFPFFYVERKMTAYLSPYSAISDAVVAAEVRIRPECDHKII